MNYTEFARFINNKPTDDEVTRLQGSSVGEWADESILIRENIYNTLYDFTDRDTGLPSFSWQYQHDNVIRVKKRLVESGIRLAGILNELLGG